MNRALVAAGLTLLLATAAAAAPVRLVRATLGS